MPTFEEQYEQLFGEKLDYDPIDISAGQQAIPTPRLALPVEDVTDPTDNDFQAKLEELSSVPRTAPQPDAPGYLGATGRALKAGAVDVGALGLGALEYGARTTALEHESPSVRRLAQGAEEVLAGGRRSLTQTAQDIMATLSPQHQAEAERMIFTMDPEQTIFQDSPLSVARSLGLKLSRMAPASLSTLLPGAVLFRVATAPTALAYMGASEAGLSLGGIQNAVAQEIEAYDPALLAQESEYFAQLVEQGTDVDEAKRLLIAEAQGAAPLIGGIAVGAISAIAGRFLQPVFEGGAGGVVSRFGRGYIAEAPQEASQGATEQLMQNVAAQVYDEDRQLSEGVLAAGLEEGALGGIFGGGVAAVTGRGPQPEGPQPAITPPLDETGPPAAPFEDVFGRGGESPFIPPDEQQGPLDPLGPRPDQATLEEGGQQALYLPQPGELEQLRSQVGVQQDLDLRQPQTLPAVREQQGQQALPLTRRERGGSAPVPEGGIDLRIPPDALPPTLEEPLTQDTEEVQARTGDIFTGYTPQVKPSAAETARREQRAKARKIEPKVEAALEAEQVVDDIPTEGATTETRAAARIIGAAAKKAAQERETRIGGFFPTKQLDWNDQGQRTRYAEQFDKLVTAETQIAMIDQEYAGEKRPPDVVNTYSQATADRKSARQELTKIRTVAQPRRKSERVVRAAKRVAPEIAPRLREEASRQPKEEVEDAAEPLPTPETKLFQQQLEPADVDKMQGKTLDDVFLQAAQIFAGKSAGVSFTYERGEGGKGAAPDVDEEIPEFIGGAESIPEGAEPLAVVTPTETEARLKPVSLKSLEMTSPGRWTYTLEAEGEADITGIVAGKRESVEKRVQELIDKRNARASAAPSQVRGQSFEQLIAAHRTPGMKRRLIKRVVAQMRRRKTGGKVGAVKLTREAKVVGTSDKPRAEAKAFFDTEVLTRETLPKDESVASRTKRLARAKTSRAALSRALTAADKTVVRLAEPKFAELANEVDDVHGNPTDAALKFRYGRMYYRQVMDFGQALINSEIDSAAALQQMEKTTKFLSEAVGMDATQFAAKMSTLAEADLRQSILMKPTAGDVRLSALKAQLADPETRAAALTRFNAKLRQHTARFIRSTEIWKRNDLYNSTVGPLMHKIADSIAKDGWPSFVTQMTPQDIEGVNWALRHWNREVDIKRDGKSRGTFREEMYKPLKRYFSELGFEFDANGEIVVPLNEDGKFETPVAVLEKQFRAMQRQKDEPAIAIDRSSESIYRDMQRTQEQIEANRNRRDLEQDVEVAARDLQLNRVIEQFRERIAHPKITVAGLVRQEQRLIRAFKELGIWSDTPSPAIGKIKHPTTGVVKNVSIAGPRLEAKKLTKDRGRKLMMNLAPFRVSVDQDLRSAAETRAQEKLNAETEMFFRQVATPKHGDAFLDTAVEIRGKLNDSPTVNGHELLDSIIATTPEGHPYNVLAQRLRELGSANLPVRWSSKAQGFQLAKNKLGVMRARPGGNNFIMLNKQAIDELQQQKDTATAAAAQIHVLLHEMVHASTMNALANDRGVRSAFKQMQTIAAREFRNRGIKPVYGLRNGDPVEEFAAEAFSNTAFQQQLQQITYEKGTLWDRLVGFVRDLLGIEAEATNLLELVMATADRVFVDSAFDPATSQTFNYEENIPDPVARQFVKIGENFFEQNKVRRAIKAGKWAGVRAPLSLMTLPQIRDTFKSRLNGLDQYYRAFKRRDARNSQLLEEAESLSRQWTRLNEEAKDNGVTATQFSWLATQATVNDVHPDKDINDPTNEHIEQDAQKKTHAELRSEFQALPEVWQRHWRDLQKYYGDSLRRESILLTQNALRATLTKGANAPMLGARFESTYSLDKVAELDTQAKLSAEFEGILEPEMIATIAAMRTLPQKRTGPYFPIMRYGDFVVEASKVRETKTFADIKEARNWRAEQLANDPTLEITVDGTAVGGATARVTEKAFLLAESATEAQLKRDELVDEYGEENVSAVTRKLDYGQASTIQSNEALGSILTQLSDNPGAQSAIRQYYLRTLADRSFRKHEIKRKNRRGYDSKLQHRNFTNYAQSASYYTAQLEYGWQMSEAMSVMREDVKATRGEGREGVRKSEVFEQLARRDKMTTDPMVIKDLVRKGVSFAQFTMLTSPSYWMINATQPYMVSFPYMVARHGVGATVSAMKNAQKMIISPLVGQAWKTKGGLAAFWSKTQTEEAFNVLDQIKKDIKRNAPDRADELITMLDELRRESILDLSWIAELRDISEGRETGIWQRTLDASRIMSHLTEVNNRIMTAIAAYDLAIVKGTQEEAIEYAKEVVAGTHFDYSSGAKPLLFRPDGPLGVAAPLVFQFMQWPQHMYAMMISNMVKVFKTQGVERAEAARILGGVLGTHILAGGLVGAALQPVKWAFGLAMMALGSEDEPYTFETAMSGETFDRYVQEGIANVAGPNISELLSRGVPASLGTDLSDRMALGTLYFMDLRPETMESSLGSLLLSVGGPWLTIGESGFRGVQDVANGNVLRGVERVAPKMLRDFLKTYRYASEGLVNNAGDTVLDGNGVPPIELFLQASGFASAEVSNFYNRQSMIKDTERYGTARRDSLVNSFSRASTPEDRREILKDVADFNRAFPAARITRSTLVRSITGKAEREASYERHGANLRGRSQIYADEGWFFQ